VVQILVSQDKDGKFFLFITLEVDLSFSVV
jgi:hypothetical protein